MRATLNDRLEHILEAIGYLQQHTGDLTWEQFIANKFLRLGIERCLEIISEASRHLPEEFKQKYAEIPWRHVADIGNRLRHGYDTVNVTPKPNVSRRGHRKGRFFG
jgi:uncharacterized protein with HEPN domain